MSVSLQRNVVLQSSRAVAACREREQELHPYPRERTGLKDPWVYFPAPPRHVINVIALRFLESWRGGGKIYFKLLSLLIRVLFVMCFLSAARCDPADTSGCQLNNNKKKKKSN